MLPQTQQHALTHIAVYRFIKIFHPPKVLPVLLGHLIVEVAIIQVDDDEHDDSDDDVDDDARQGRA